MTEYINYYFPNGCTECGGEIKFLNSLFIYKCKECGCFASAHRQNTPNSKKYEPYQNLSTKEINKLRKELRNIFDLLWNSRILILRKNVPNPIYEALINIIYTENLRIFEGVEPPFVFVTLTSKGKCDVETLSKEKIKDLNYQDLKVVRNRDKAYMWLSKELGIPFELCRIGYLTEQQLIKAIEICTQNVNKARTSGINPDQRGS